LKPEEREECEVYYEIQRRISENQNSKKKAAQRELVTWKDSHKESLWNPILSRYDSKIQLEKKMESLAEDIRMATDAFASPTSCNIPIVQKRRLLLEEYGFLEDGLRLTPYGRLSSEINEGHPFLMVELYIQQTTTLSPLCLKDLLTVLSLFIGDGKDEFVLSHLNVSKGIIEVLSHLNRTATTIVDLEHKHRIPYDNQFWSLSTEWVDPVAEWLEVTVSVAELAMKYELFEGNVQKALMKLSALLEEFQALATMSGNVDMLDKLAEARPLVLRDLVLAESLYLRV
jgi:superfamily II RNA helicase